MFGYGPRWHGRRMFLCTGLFLAGLSTTLQSTAQEPLQWTLPDALANAFAHSPALHARRAALDEVASRLVGARVYAHNPTLSIEVANRRSPGSSTTDHGLSVSQELEIGGQRRARTAVAREDVAAAEASWLRDQQMLAFGIESAFAEAVRKRELADVAQVDADLAHEMLAFSQRRLDRGAATQIEVNLARASAGRAERSLQRSRAAYASACSRLAALAGGNPIAPAEPLGDLTFPQGDVLPLAELVERAHDNRGDLRSAQRQERAAEAAIRLALAERRPNLVVGGYFQREESTDEILGATIGVSLPFFDRNQGRLAETRALRERRHHERDALRLAVEREVTTARNNLRAAQAAAEYLRDQVVATLEDNVALLHRSFIAGRINATEVITLRREFVASRREYIDVLADAWLARIELELATGRLKLPQPSPAKELP